MESMFCDNSAGATPGTVPLPSDPASPSPAQDLLVVIDCNQHTCRLKFIDMKSHQIEDTLDLGLGNWCGLCAHHSHPSDEESLVMVSEIDLQIVNVFDMKTKRLVRSIGLGGTGLGPGHLDGPYFLCMCHTVGAGYYLMVSNWLGHRIDVFDFESGRHIRSIGGGQGSSPGQLFNPAAIAVWTSQDDPTNAQIVVADYGNHRLQFFCLSDGKYVRSVGEAGEGPGQIKHPAAMSIHMPAGGRDDEALLVTIGFADSLIHVISLVSGVYLRSLGGGVGDGVDQISRYCAFSMVFHKPVGEDEAATQVIVCDSDMQRLQVFNLYSGGHICSIGGGDSGLFDTPQTLHMICSVNDDDWDYVLK